MFDKIAGALGVGAGDVFGAATAGLGALFGKTAAQSSAEDAYRESRKAAKKQMEFAERMSNTAHQRQMADLQAAGLNPVLAAKLGGASTPGGAAFGMTAPNLGAAMAAGGQLTGQAATATNVRQQTKLNKAQTEIAQRNADIATVQANAIKNNPSLANAMMVKDVNPMSMLFGSVMSRMNEKEVEEFASSAVDAIRGNAEVKGDIKDEVGNVEDGIIKIPIQKDQTHFKKKRVIKEFEKRPGETNTEYLRRLRPHMKHYFPKEYE